MKRGFAALFCMVLLFLFTGCLDSPSSTDNGIVDLTGVVVLNEGNFGQGNGSLTVFDPETEELLPDAFSSVNGRPLGDVANDMLLFNGKGYIVVNNSDRMEVIDLDTYESTGTLEFVEHGSPYRMTVSATANTGYVSHLYANRVSIVDLATLTVTGGFSVGNNPMGLHSLHERVFVLNSGFGSDSTVTVFNITTGNVETTLTVDHGPIEILSDPNGVIWMLCTGQFGDWTDPSDVGTPGSIYRMFYGDLAPDRWIEFSSRPSRMALGPDGFLYVVTHEGVHRVSTAAKNSSQLIIPGSFYGIQADWFSGELYVTDPRDYVVQGDVNIYSFDGEQRGSFTAGIIPSRVLFIYGN
jgi:DNA-binding beta-propeller fold protein YncE